MPRHAYLSTASRDQPRPPKSTTLFPRPCFLARNVEDRKIARGFTLPSAIPALIRFDHPDLVRNIVLCLPLPATLWHQPEVLS